MWIQNLQDLQVDYRCLFKLSSNNWRQLIKIDKIDACLMASGLHSLPFVDQFFKLLKSMVNGQIPMSCPLDPGEYYAYNLTMPYDTGQDLIIKTLTPSFLPNGIYRNFFRVSFPNDPDGLFNWNVLELNDRNRENKFWFNKIKVCF